MMKWRQYRLRTDGAWFTCWLQAGLNVGDRLTLKDMPREWIVENRYPIEMDRPPEIKWEVDKLS